jgi:crossover junction endodeoxyribonuclease RuvC
MRTLGIDPGTIATGWGVIDENGQSSTYVAGGVIRGRGLLANRLLVIFDALRQVLSQYQPACVALEKTFVGENVQSAFRLGEARGVILLAAEMAGVRVVEYAPAEVKVAVAGGGRATKDQMQLMVSRLLNLNADVASDEADALGVAICHMHTQRFRDSVGEPIPFTKRPSRRSAGTLKARRR